MTSSGKDDLEKRSLRLMLRDEWDRVLEGSGPFGRALSAALLIMLAVGSGLLLGPRGHQAIPYDVDDVGRFVVGTLKAHRNYRIEDQEATEHKRREARETVPSVYDYEWEVRDQTVRRVREAFSLMRAVWLEHQRQIIDELERQAVQVTVGTEDALDTEDEPLDEGAALGTGELVDEQPVAELGDPSAADISASEAAASEASIFHQHKDTFLQQLQLPLDDASFDALARELFSVEIERAVIFLVREGMALPIIADQQLIAADRMRGITLRPTGDRGAQRERMVRDVAGEIRDLASARAASSEKLTEVLPEAAPSTRAVTGRLARRLVRPTLYFNPDETERRRNEAEASVRATFIELEAGEKIIGDGERIEPRHLVIFQGIREQAAASRTPNIHMGAALLAVLVALTLFSFARAGGVWRFRPSRKDLLFLLTTLMGTVLAVRGGMFFADALADRMPVVSGAMLYYAIPAGAAVVLVRLVLSGETTLIFAVLLAGLVGALADHSLGYALFTLVGGLVAAESVGKAADRGGIWRAGMLMGLVNMLLVAAVGLHEGRELGDIYPAVLSGAVAGAITPVLVLGLAILVENVFKYTTDLKLLELANMNNPLLKELVVLAPGTYHHSMLIGSMVETAAEAIGANPLLARVGAYYHDIGKGKSPLYFAENQRGENLHDKLTPSMSALVVRRHVTDGVKMARSAGLPEAVIEMIPMHHGTRLMTFFYHRAKEEAERRGEPVPSETDYRYSGPKPRFREAALLMIADSVEAAARTIVEPTTDRLRGLVQKVINSCFADGQFDECNITLKDLHAITRSFVTTLEAMHHSRPEYHQPADKVTERSPRNGESSASGSSKGPKDAKADDFRAAPEQQDKSEPSTDPEDGADGDVRSQAGGADAHDDAEASSVEVLKRLGTG